MCFQELVEIDSKKTAQLVLVVFIVFLCVFRSWLRLTVRRRLSWCWLVLLCFCVCFQELVEIDSKKTAQLVLVVFIVFLCRFSGAG